MLSEPPNQTTPITWENFFIASKGMFTEVEEIPKNFTPLHKSRGSEYFISYDKKVLIRRSNHWGYGIRFCNWYLKGYGYDSCRRWKKNVDSPCKIGRVNINDLKPT